MRGTTQIFCGVVLAIVFGGCCVKASIKCYTCEPGLRCDASVYVPLPQDLKDDCNCCTKHVTSSGTTRNCQSGLASVACTPIPSVHHVCLSDYCNAGHGLAPRSILVGILASASAALLAVNRLI